VATSVKISWDLPTENFYSVDQYEILIKDSTTAFRENTQYCDGTDPDIVTNRECYIPMTALTSSPFNLAAATLIEVKVRGYNERGEGGYSPVSTTAQNAETIPT